MADTEKASRNRVAGRRMARLNRDLKLREVGWPGSGPNTFSRPVTLDGGTVEVLSIRGGNFWVYDAGAGLVIVARTEEAAILKMATARDSRKATGLLDNLCATPVTPEMANAENQG